MSTKSAFMQQLEALPEDLRNFLLNAETSEPEFKDLEEGEHIVTIQGLIVLNSTHKNWKLEVKENLPEYKDFTPQTGIRFVSAEGKGSIVHRVNHLAYRKMRDLSDAELESGKFHAVGDEGNEYACTKNKDGELERVPSEEGMKGVYNIQNQIAHALGKTGKPFPVALDEAMQEKIQLGIRIEDQEYGNRIYSKVVAFFPVKASVTIDADELASE